MENKYKNDIPNKNVRRCAFELRVDFIYSNEMVWKSDAITMAEFKMKEFNNRHASRKSGQVTFGLYHWVIGFDMLCQKNRYS